MCDYLGPYLLGPNDKNQGIYTGDARELAEAVPDKSTSLILCDPVYDDFEFYRFVAETGARILKPGGNCVVQFAHYYLPQTLKAMSEHLEYFWLDSERVGVNARLWSKRIFINWKPYLWMWKPSDNGRLGGWVRDSFWSPPSKQFHEWGDGLESMLTFLPLTVDNDPVVDFCTGGASVPGACKVANCRWLAFEIDPETAERARERVRMTQPPLFVPEPEQLEMGLTTDKDSSR